MEPSYQVMFKRWKPNITDAPKNGTWFMGRISNSNRAKAVKYEGETQRWITRDEGAVNICQWISFTDFADIRSCVWRSM